MELASGQLLAVTPFIKIDPTDKIVEAEVRFRTVGDATCTAAVRSQAHSIDDIIEDLLHTQISERGATRIDDRVSEAAMEDRKVNGYF